MKLRRTYTRLKYKVKKIGALPKDDTWLKRFEEVNREMRTSIMREKCGGGIINKTEYTKERILLIIREIIFRNCPTRTWKTLKYKSWSNKIKVYATLISEEI